MFVAVRTELLDLKSFCAVLAFGDCVVAVETFFANQKRFFPTHTLSSLSAWKLYSQTEALSIVKRAKMRALKITLACEGGVCCVQQRVLGIQFFIQPVDLEHVLFSGWTAISIDLMNDRFRPIAKNLHNCFAIRKGQT